MPKHTLFEIYMHSLIYRFVLNLLRSFYFIHKFIFYKSTQCYLLHVISSIGAKLYLRNVTFDVTFEANFPIYVSSTLIIECYF